MRKYLYVLFLLIPLAGFSQQKSAFNASFESNSQYYFNDIAKNIRDKDFASNNYLDLSYRYGKFEVGSTFESYFPNPLLGFANAYDDSGLTKKYISYQSEKLKVRLGWIGCKLFSI